MKRVDQRDATRVDEARCRRFKFFSGVFAVAVFWGWAAVGELVINEMLFNPPGADAPNQYIEVRGTPNQLIAPGTYLVAVQGNAGANPGTIENVFDLGSRRVGGNGFLVLLQKTNSYLPNAGATIVVNSGSGSGWGSGGSSTLGHYGNQGATDLSHPSVTFFLIQAPKRPSVGVDLDANNDGVLDGDEFSGWTLLDSIGVLDDDGVGDFAYAAVNFRRDSPPGSAAQATGVVVPVGFTPRYVGRTGNNWGTAATNWLAGDALAGVAPEWSLGSAANTFPPGFAGAPLNHLGSPNFGGPKIPGVVVSDGGSARVLEGGEAARFSIGLNTAPSGPVTIRLTAATGLEISSNSAAGFASGILLQLDDAIPREISVRAVEDQVIGRPVRALWITNSMTATTDEAQYPLTTIIPDVKVEVTDNDPVLLSELEVNPPGTNDSAQEYIEIKGPPGALISNVHLLVIEGEAGQNPGTVRYARDLGGLHLGSNGCIILVAPEYDGALTAAATVVVDPLLSAPGGVLGNQSISFLLLSSASKFQSGVDLDAGDNGKLEGLPDDALLLDAVGWTTGGKNDLVYGGVELVLTNGAPDAATRLPGNDVPNSASAWVFGDLLGPDSGSLVYGGDNVSSNLPAGTQLSPGTPNKTAPAIQVGELVSGVIGDASNPPLRFSVISLESSNITLSVTAVSLNQAVAPDTNLVVSVTGQGDYSLRVEPVGVGYADLVILVSDGTLTGRVAVPYAASAPGRSGGVWHLGASDGSTAVPIDSNYMLVGDDENQTLRLYSRAESGLPVSRFDMTSFLDLPDLESGLPREVDVEASTRVGDTLVWMGSHGHAEIGESRTNRTRVFSTILSGTGQNAQLTYAGRYDYLKADLIDWDSHNVHGRGSNYFGLEASDAPGVLPKAEDGSGFGIEGLAMMPGSTTGAYIAFRAPIVAPSSRDYALIVPVLNFVQLAVQGGPRGSCAFGPPIELDLYGRGIRSIEGSTNGYIIIAGPAGLATGIYPRDYRLYTWSGNAADPPQLRTTDLSDLTPEGIVEVPSGPWTELSVVELLSDCGALVLYGDGIPAKRLAIPNFKKCRSDRLALGRVTLPPPVVTGFEQENNVAVIRWRALRGATYRIQSASRLEPADWKFITSDIIASDLHPATQVMLEKDGQFYRVALISP